MSELICRFCRLPQEEHTRYGNNYLCKPQIVTSTTYPALPQFVESPIETEFNAVQERLNKLLAKAFRDGYEAGKRSKYSVIENHEIDAALAEGEQSSTLVEKPASPGSEREPQ